MIETKTFMISIPHKEHIINGMYREHEVNSSALKDIDDYIKKKNLTVISIESVFEPNTRIPTNCQHVIAYKVFMKPINEN